MFPVVPIRVQLRGAGYGLVLLALLALVYSWNQYSSPNPSTLLSLQSLVALTVVGMLATCAGLLMSHDSWKRWRGKLESQTPVVPHELALHSTHMYWTWTFTQLCAGVFLLGMTLALASLIFRHGSDSRSLVIVASVSCWQLGVTYLVQAHRIAHLERQRGGIYYWRRQPALEHTKAPVLLIYS